LSANREIFSFEVPGEQNYQQVAARTKNSAAPKRRQHKIKVSSNMCCPKVCCKNMF